MNNKKSVSVVIPNYNGRQLLEQYLPFTFEAIKNAGVAYEVIVVDDGSTDESVSYIRSTYPDIKLLVNGKNSGFSYSCNQGIAAAQCDLILLLNSDVKLTPNYFDSQWKYFDMPDTFGVMGRIIDMEGGRIQDAARLPKFNGLKLKTAFFYYTDTPDDILYTFYLSGANALVDAAKLKAIGGFFELFSPFYCEDMELSLRAWRLGWKCYYEHSSVCRHQVSASTKNYKTAKWVKSIYYRNRFYMHALHLDGLALLGWYIQITVIDLIPKLLAGQFWIWSSYTALFADQTAVKQCKQRIKNMLQQSPQRFSIFKVISFIRNSVKGKQLIRIKL